VAAETKEQNAAARLVEQQQQQAQALADVKAAQDKALNDLREAFAALSLKALKETQPEFLRLANETFEKLAKTAEGNLKARQEAIDAVVKPLKDQLAEYQKRLQTAEQKQTETIGAVRQQLEALQNQSQSLAGETNKLRLVLSSSQARGRWGEETLRRVVEAAGMSPHCDFLEQTAAGDARPDLLVKLPGDRVIIVDSKVPDLDFLAALGSADETTRREKLAGHAAKLKGTIQALAKREYPKQFPTALDKVVLFVPAESLLSAALEGDPNLIVDAGTENILLATPSSLIALLYAVAMSWQQDAQTKNARDIADAGMELFERVAKFVEHFAAVHDGLEKTAAAYNKAVASFESRVRPSGDRLVKLAGISPEAALPEAKPVETMLRVLPDVKS
jgi:DNA recombination protein RmuC